MSSSLDVVIPVYREHESIIPVIRSLEAAVKVPHRVVLVHDTPDDPTLDAARSLQSEVRELAFLHNRAGGYAEAIRTGLRESRGDVVCLFTADGSDRPEDIGVMMARINDGADMVLGSRYVPGGEKRGGPLAMNLLSRFGNRLFHWVSGVPVTDVTTSFRAIRRRVINEVPFESHLGGALYLELTVRALQKGFKLAEVPTIWVDRKKGESKFKLLRWLPGLAGWFLWGVFAYRFGRRRG